MQGIKEGKMINQLERREYLEALMRPKFEKSLESLLNKYSYLQTDYHPQTLEELLDIFKRALEEGNSVIIQPEYLGWFVTLWSGTWLRE